MKISLLPALSFSGALHIPPVSAMHTRQHAITTSCQSKNTVTPPSPNDVHAPASLSLLKTSTTKPITRSIHPPFPSPFPTPPRALSPAARLPIPPGALPTLSSRAMASAPAPAPSAPAPSAPGPVLARAMTDPTFYQEADTAGKIAVETAVAEEKLRLYFGDGGARVVHKGSLAGKVDEGQHCGGAVWHVFPAGAEDRLWVVYVYAHAEAGGESSCMVGLRRVLGDEIREAEKGGRVRGGKTFGIAQAGMGISFFEYGGGGGGGELGRG